MPAFIALFAFLLSPLAHAADPVGCLPAPDLDDLLDEEGVLYSAGLSSRQVASTVDEASVQAAACVQPGASTQGTVEVNLRVDCSGRVVTAAAGRMRGLQPSVVACVLAVFEETVFPAHDVREGFEFGVLMTLDY